MTELRCDQTVAWSALQGHWQAHGRDLDLRTLFHADPDRVNRLTIQAPEVLGDLSRCKWDVATTRHLFDLARECQIEARRDAMLRGEVINLSEGREVLHTALRAPKGQAPHSDQVHAVLDQMLAFVERVRATAGGSQSGDIHDVVNIGIGGSDLGPQMVVAALDPFVHPRLRFHFVSNVDGHDLAEVLRRVDAKHTLFIVASKTFTTLETMANAHVAKRWFLEQGGQDIARHFVATTTNVQAAAEFGVTTTFGFWDWVGGRYSMWSSIGLPIALALGAEHFRSMLAGAHDMDGHFASAPLERNLPVCLGLLDLWYRNFHGYASRCVAPYHHGLRRLPTYLQQLVMESNGKGVDAHGAELNCSTSAVVWGEPGTNAQHAFFQMIHQGTDVIPVDFILIKRPTFSEEAWLSPALRTMLEKQHAILLANGLAQAQALMWGKTTDEAEREPRPSTASKTVPARELALQRTFPGNRPSLTLLLDELTPKALGALVALYEHRTFVTGALWGINSFDQWGVELGKVLCQEVSSRMQGGELQGMDAATTAMLQRLR
ncbi:MAG: glucose-6-phosphate isomerase [Burkholderiales bacterium]|nr:glucose-6-phosphate isomerase [Burkholderiales bacterium]MDE2431581.1 glucose-6-phosphate isomerase [Burkholderiales bacterium]